MIDLDHDADLGAILEEVTPGATSERAARHPMVTPEAKLHSMVAVSLVQVATEVQKRLDAYVRPFNVSMSRMAVLLHLYFSDAPLQPSSLGVRMLVTRANVTGLIDGLVHGGLVSRVQPPEDRRAWEIALTKAGAALVEEYLPYHLQAMRAVTAGLDPEEARTFVRLVHKLRHGMQALEPPTRASSSHPKART